MPHQLRSAGSESALTAAGAEEDRDEKGGGAEEGPCLPGLNRSDTVRVVRLMELASEASAATSAATATASQFLRASTTFGCGASGTAAALDTAARDAVLAFKLGMQLRRDRSEYLQIGAGGKFVENPMTDMIA